MTEPTRLTPIEELCNALHSGGFVLTAESRDTLSLRPRAGVSNAMAAAITKYRAKLIDFLIDRAPCAPYPCSYCCGEFVSTPEERCPGCESLRGKPLRFDPTDPDFSLFLRAYESRHSAGKTVPTLPTAGNRPGWDSSSKTLPPYAATT